MNIPKIKVGSYGGVCCCIDIADECGIPMRLIDVYSLVVDGYKVTALGKAIYSGSIAEPLHYHAVPIPQQGVNSQYWPCGVSVSGADSAVFNDGASGGIGGSGGSGGFFTNPTPQLYEFED